MWSMKSMHKTIHVDWGDSAEQHGKEAVLMLKIRYAKLPYEYSKRNGLENCIGYVALEVHWFDGHCMYRELATISNNCVEFESYLIERSDEGGVSKTNVDSYDDFQGDLYVLKLFNIYDCWKRDFDSVPDSCVVPVSYLCDKLHLIAA